MIVVRFGDVGEYLEELRFDTAHLGVERRVVRTTKWTRPTGTNGMIRRLYVESTYVKTARPSEAIKYQEQEQIVDYGADAQLVRLTLAVGVVGLGENERDAQLLANADKTVAAIDQAVRDLDLDSRAGLHEVANADA